MLVEDQNKSATNCSHSSFSDVLTDVWFFRPVCIAQLLGIIDGYPDGSFRPANAILVAEALKMIYKALDIPVVHAAGELWFAPFLNHAKAYEILFADLDLAEEISRKDVVWIMWKLMAQP